MTNMTEGFRALISLMQAQGRVSPNEKHYGPRWLRHKVEVDGVLPWVRHWGSSLLGVKATKQDAMPRRQRNCQATAGYELYSELTVCSRSIKAQHSVSEYSDLPHGIAISPMMRQTPLTRDKDIFISHSVHAFRAEL